MHENNSKQEIKSKETKKPDIKIFVSHRIDMDAETIDNPLYVNVRCGAVFDKRENVDMLGDNTGDNISEKRESFNELTVMYWAWKNVEADYYGLCHYRRYLSFSKQFHEINEWAKNGVSANSIVCDYIDSNMIEKYNLNEEYMRNEISKYDIIKMNAIDFAQLSHKYFNDRFKTNKEQIEFDKVWHRIEDFETVRQIIEEKFSEYLKYYDEYMNSKYGYFYLLFIMNKKYFNIFCEFIFGVLFELEKRIDTTYLSEKQYRIYGTIAERLYGVFMLYMQDKFDIKIAEKQVIFVENPQKQKELLPFSKENNIPIVVRISDYYAPYFGVLLQSIIDNADEKNNYDIIVLEHTVTKENKKIIAEMLQGKNNISVRYLNPEYFLSNISLFISFSAFAREAYYTIIAPWLLKNYDKLLIIDSDIIAVSDIAKIYNIDIQDKSIAACKDLISMGMCTTDLEYLNYLVNELYLDNPYDYVNTGVVILNASKIRKQFKFNDLIDKMTTQKYRFQEQCLINKIWYNDVYFLEYFCNYYIKGEEHITNLINSSPRNEKAIYEKSKKEAILYHYLSIFKPWINPYYMEAYKWWEIARKTPFYEMIFIRMTHEQSSHISFSTLDHFSRVMFPFKWLKKVHKIGYIRQITDKLLPHGSKRRKIVKKLMFK